MCIAAFTVGSDCTRVAEPCQENRYSIGAAIEAAESANEINPGVSNKL
jgi:hypothetical protein